MAQLTMSGGLCRCVDARRGTSRLALSSIDRLTTARTSLTTCHTISLERHASGLAATLTCLMSKLDDARHSLMRTAKSCLSAGAVEIGDTGVLVVSFRQSQPTESRPAAHFTFYPTDFVDLLYR